MRDQRRTHDDEHPLPVGSHPAVQPAEQWERDHEQEQLPELHAHVERGECREQVTPGELQPFAEREREAEAVNEAEPEGHHPAVFEPVRRQDDVLEREPDDRRRDQHLDQRREPARRGREAECREAERERVCDGEGGDDGDQ